MNKLTLFLSAVTIALSSCGGGGSADVKTDSQAMMAAKIDSIYAAMGKKQMFDQAEAMNALRLYVEYSTKYPNDSLTPEYLFRASDIAQGTGNYQQAVEFLETILAKHPTFHNYEAAMFSAAMIYDDHLEQVNHGDERALQLYDELIQKYPSSSYAEQSKILKTYVGKPDSVFFNDVRRKADSIEAEKK
jgi:outer membrane protein assembly factor BamD (BamD/ComL family)